MVSAIKGVNCTNNLEVEKNTKNIVTLPNFDCEILLMVV